MQQLNGMEASCFAVFMTPVSNFEWELAVRCFYYDFRWLTGQVGHDIIGCSTCPFLSCVKIVNDGSHDCSSESCEELLHWCELLWRHSHTAVRKKVGLDQAGSPEGRRHTPADWWSKMSTFKCQRYLIFQFMFFSSTFPKAWAMLPTDSLNLYAWIAVC